jgi:high affinity sulfate transporter 1
MVPALAWVRDYDVRFLRFDVVAGATLWGLLVPEMIAYAGLAGLPPEAGLYTLLATLAAYAVFGTSRHLVVAGTSAAAVLLASGVSDRGPSGPAEYAALAAALVLMVGGLFLVAGLLRLGFVAQFLSRPVMVGFVFGLAIFVTVNQLPLLFGIEKGDGNTIQQLASLLSDLGETSGETLVVGVVALAILFGLDRVAPRAPGGLIVLVLGIAGGAALSLPERGVDAVGEVTSGIPGLGFPDIAGSDALALFAIAAGTVLVIYGESLAAAQTYASKHGYEIDANQEMIALGVANLGSGALGGLAAGGSLSQTAVNEGAGARSEASPVVAAGLALITVIALTPLFEDLPEAVLAALIIHAVSHLMRVAEFRRYWRVRRPEFVLGLATLLGVITIDVLPGLLIGVVAMLLLVIWHSSRPHLSVLGTSPTAPGAWRDLGRHPTYVAPPGLEVVRLEAPLYYANARLVRDGIKRLVGSADPTPRGVIIDLGASVDLDITSADMLTDLATTLHAAGIDLALADVRAHVRRMIEISGLAEALGPGRVFRTITEAVEALGPDGLPRPAPDGERTPPAPA